MRQFVKVLILGLIVVLLVLGTYNYHEVGMLDWNTIGSLASALILGLIYWQGEKSSRLEQRRFLGKSAKGTMTL
jgi:hypothetical protein